MLKKLAIIGASYLQKPLVEKANDLGFYTICFAWEEGAVCKDICDEFYPISIIEKEEILCICKKLKIHGVVSIASDIAVPTVNFIANKLNLIGNSIQSSLLSTNKVAMRKAFKVENLPIPNFIEVDVNFDKKELLKLALPLIVKPVDRSGSRGVSVVKSVNQFEQAITYAINESFVKKAIVEEFIVGKEISVESISWKGSHYILAYTDKVTTGFPHFVELEHHQPSVFYNSIFKTKIDEIVKRGINSLDIRNGATHSELIISKDNKIYFTEIGGRMGGDFIGSDLVYLSTSFDYLKATIEVSLDIFNKPTIRTDYYAGVYFFTAKTKRIKKYMKDNAIIKYEFNNLNKKEILQSSDRSGFMIYKSNSKLKI